MSIDIRILPINEVYIKVSCDEGIQQELYEHFSFYAPGFQYTPLFRKKLWDGKIHLFSKRNNLLYQGLLNHLLTFCQERNYTPSLDENLSYGVGTTPPDFLSFIDKLKLPMTPRDYQLDAFLSAITRKREVLVSPTASGKSLILYLIARYLQSHGYKKGLIVVPTTSLVEQLYTDFQSYGWNDLQQHVHRVYAGHQRTSPHFLTISTWQSMYTQTPDFFTPFDFILGDEAHLFKAKSLTQIMTNLVNARVRIGCTGTLDGSKVHKLVLEGLFGPARQVTTTKELMDKKELAELRIKCIILRYPEAVRKQTKKYTYDEEVDFIVRHRARQQFIKKLALALNTNTLILFQFVEKHGKDIYNILREADPERSIDFVFGGTKTEQRELIRKKVEGSKNAIIVASYGTFSTGINIKNLHNIIFAHPSKSQIRNLQSIGRGLRTVEGKTHATLFDIVDDLRIGKHKNSVLKHFLERVSIYDSQKFSYKFFPVDLKGDV